MTKFTHAILIQSIGMMKGFIEPLNNHNNIFKKHIFPQNGKVFTTLRHCG